MTVSNAFFSSARGVVLLVRAGSHTDIVSASVLAFFPQWSTLQLVREIQYLL
jgi:hypothetical protein